MAFCDIIFLLILNCQEKGLSFYIISPTNVNLFLFEFDGNISEDVLKC